MAKNTETKKNPVFEWEFNRIYPMYIDKAETKVRYLDKLAKGKAMEKILRTP